jgi:hypothetical protein
MTRGLSIREYARYRRAAGLKGGTPSAVHKAIKTGRIHRDDCGFIDPAQADAAWEAGTDPTRGDSLAGPSRQRHVPPSPPSSASQPASSGSAPTYATSRAIREAYTARLAKLSYEERSKILVDASRVEAEAFRRSRDARDALLAVPGRLAAILAAETDPAVVEVRLTEELRVVLEALANG